MQIMPLRQDQVQQIENRHAVLVTLMTSGTNRRLGLPWSGNANVIGKNVWGA